MELHQEKLYINKNIIKTSTVYKKANIDNDYLYSLDKDGNIYVCNPQTAAPPAAAAPAAATQSVMGVANPSDVQRLT